MDVSAPLRRTTVTTALVAVLCGSAGCRAILGIDEDVPLLGGETTGDGASPAEPAERHAEVGTPPPNADDASTSSAADAGPVVPADRRHALWPLAPSSPPLAQYELTDDVVRDRLTGLTWTRKDTVPALFAYAGAAAYCDGLSLDGFDDWRVPTRIEQISTFDFTIPFRVVNPTVFVLDAANREAWWTSSENAFPSTSWSRYTIDPFTGNVSLSLSPAAGRRGRCVRGGPSTMPGERLALGASGETVIDRATKLEWQRAVPNTMSFEDAKAACGLLYLAGHDDFVLPDARELASLVDETRTAYPRLDPLFEVGAQRRFWSATILANPATMVWSVDMDTAGFVNEDLAGRLAVRCVRRLP